MSLKVYGGIRFKLSYLSLFSEYMFKMDLEQALEHTQQLLNMIQMQGFRFEAIRRYHLMEETYNTIPAKFEKYKSNWPDSYADKLKQSLYLDWLVEQLSLHCDDIGSGNPFSYTMGWNLWPLGSWVYGYPYGDNAMTRAGAAVKHPDRLVQEYHYQNQSDPPDYVPSKQWAERGRIWNKLTDYTYENGYFEQKLTLETVSFREGEFSHTFWSIRNRLGLNPYVWHNEVEKAKQNE